MGQDGAKALKGNERFGFQEIEHQIVDNSATKINVLFIIIQMNMGGSERLVYNLVSKLDRKVFNPSVAWFFGDKPLQEFLDLKIPLFHIPKKSRFDFSAMGLLWQVIKQNKINVVNTHHFFSMVYAFPGCKLLSRHCSLIYTEHSAWELEGISQKWKFFGRHLLKHIDYAVGVIPLVTQGLGDVLNLPASRLSTILNGVDLDEFRSSGKNIHEIRKSLDIKDGERVIGTVGNFRQVKNHVFLIKAFSELLKVFTNVRLVIIGRGSPDDPENSEQEVKDKIQELGIMESVSLLGYRSDVREILGIMDAFCLTSFKEGLPISLIEAMAAGLPVVGTNVEGIRDVIVPHHNGFLVELGDVNQLKNILLDLLNHPEHRERLGRAGRHLAEEKYSLDRCVSEYEALFLSSLPSSKINQAKG